MERDTFHFAVLPHELNAPLGKVAESVRKALNFLDDIFPGYTHGIRGVQRLIKDIRTSLMEKIPSGSITREGLVMLRKSLNFCTFPHAPSGNILEQTYQEELRRWHELRVHGNFLGSHSPKTYGNQRRNVQSYFHAIDNGELERVFNMYGDKVEYSRMTFVKKDSCITSLEFPPLGDVGCGPAPIIGKGQLTDFFTRARGLSGKHTIHSLESLAHGWVMSEGSFEGIDKNKGNRHVHIPLWRDVVRFGDDGKIAFRRSMIEVQSQN